MTEQQPHSAEYFGKQRDFWWNDDFLALMAQRWRLGEARRVLDVGCGVGHWGQLLAPWLAKDAEVVGIDREKEWIARATERARSRAAGRTFRYQAGDATHIDFPDNTFDLVTCQTVLIHQADPLPVLREFRRVVKPGGLVAVAEPNNLTGALSLSNIDDTVPTPDLASLVRLQLTCERGKRALGQGYNSVGDFLPGLFAQIGLQDRLVYLSDKAAALVPPYASEAEQAVVEQAKDWADREFWIWSRDETYRYFMAGGGTDADFETLWTLAGRIGRQRAEGLRQGRLHCGGGVVTYLISGRK